MIQKMAPTILFAFVVMASSPIAAEGAGRTTPDPWEVLEYYAPYIVQDLDCPNNSADESGFGDYITRVDFDGNYQSNDNWEHLGRSCFGICGDASSDCEPEYPTPAWIYGSTIETSTHYILFYSLFHPADDFHCHGLLDTKHENDEEDVMLVVYKDGTDYGLLRMVQTQAHGDMKVYVSSDDDSTFVRFPYWDPPWALEWISGAFETYPVDGIHPILYVEGGGHGVFCIVGQAGEMDGDAIVHYAYKGVAEQPSNAHHVTTYDPWAVSEQDRVGYGLLPAPSLLWQRRLYYGGNAYPDTLFNGPKDYVGDRFFYESNPLFLVDSLGEHFEANTCDPPWPVDPRRATPPWFQGESYITSGDWALDPAYVLNNVFGFPEPVSVDYTFHPYLMNDLMPVVFDSLKHFDSPGGNYNVKYDVTIPAGETLHFDPTRPPTLQFHPGRALRAEGELFTSATGGVPISFGSIEDSVFAERVLLRGTGASLRLENGGGIVLH